MAMCQLKECLRANIEFARKNLHVKGSPTFAMVDAKMTNCVTHENREGGEGVKGG